MGFLSGSMSFTRFEITEDPSGAFGDKHLEVLEKNQADQNADKTNDDDEGEVGFVAGDHVFDMDFGADKNIIGETLYFGVRVDAVAIPSPIKKAWLKMELKAIMLDQQGKRPSREQKQEAEAAVDQRCRDEADKGNYRRIGITQVVWDAATSVLYIGSCSAKVVELVSGFIESKFKLKLRLITPTTLAGDHVEENSDQYEALVSTRPSAFVEAMQSQVTWWNGMGDNYDFLGNEFLIWLWWHWETQSTVVDLEDETDLSGMFSKVLSLDCPIGDSGKETISSLAPAALPEAMMAIQMGKQPRKAGLNLTRDGEQYEFTLQAETFAVNAARVVNQTEINPGNDREVRIQSLRNLGDTIDLLFSAFLNRRLDGWENEFAKIQKWLGPNAKRRVSAA